MGSLFIGILVYFYVLHHNLWLVQTLELMFGYINTPNANLQKKKKLMTSFGVDKIWNDKLFKLSNEITILTIKSFPH
jgi:hypothetical protein